MRELAEAALAGRGVAIRQTLANRYMWETAFPCDRRADGGVEPRRMCVAAGGNEDAEIRRS